MEEVKEDPVRLEGADLLSDVSSEAPADVDEEVLSEEEDEDSKPDYMDNNYWWPAAQMSLEDLLADYL